MDANGSMCVYVAVLGEMVTMGTLVQAVQLPLEPNQGLGLIRQSARDLNMSAELPRGSAPRMLRGRTVRSSADGG
jgi:hypothetical protein